MGGFNAYHGLLPSTPFLRACLGKSLMDDVRNRELCKSDLVVDTLRFRIARFS